MNAVLDELWHQAVQDKYIEADDGGIFRLTERGKRRAYLLAECLGIADEEYPDTVAAGLSLVAYGRPDLTVDGLR